MNRITITPREAAEYLGISYDHLLDLINAGEIPYIQIGKRKFFTLEILNDYLIRCRH